MSKSSQEPLSTHRIVVLGRQKVGKTAILRQFFDKYFEEKYRETIEDLYTRIYSLNGRVIKVEVMDTAGNMEYPAMRKLNINSAQAFVIVYAATEPKSLETVTEIFKEIKELRPLDFNVTPLVLVSNKYDQICNSTAEQTEPLRDAGSEWIEKWMMKNGATNCKFSHISTSAKTGENIIELFVRLAKLSDVEIGDEPTPITSRGVSKPPVPVLMRRLSLQPDSVTSKFPQRSKNKLSVSEKGNADYALNPDLANPPSSPRRKISFSSISQSLSLKRNSQSPRLKTSRPSRRSAINDDQEDVQECFIS